MPTAIPRLLELQTLFRRAVLGGDASEIAAWIQSDGLDAEARLRIHRNHAFAKLSAVLQGTFPVVCRLVDQRFFAYAAHDFLREHPPHSRCLIEYGDAFADFLAGFEPCRNLPYLADVARFEWAVHVTTTVRETAPLRIEALAALSAEQAPLIQLRLQPSLSYFTSGWPVDAVWQANQTEEVPPVDLASGGCSLEIRRVGDGAVWRRLDLGAFAFRKALAEGSALAAAISAATLRDPDFDATSELKQVLVEGLAVGFGVSPGGEHSR
jgi:Putative DNA-binding domain